MTSEVAWAAIRMIAWVVILGGLAPRLLFRDGESDGPTRVARMATLAAFCAIVLWLCRQLSSGTFLGSLAVYGVGNLLRSKQYVVAHFARVFNLLMVGLVHDRGEILRDVAGDGARENRSDSGSKRVPRRKQIGTLTLKWGVAISATAKRLNLASAAPGLPVGRKRLGGWLRQNREALLVHAMAFCTAIGSVISRSTLEYPLSTSESERLLILAGWKDAGHAWLPDLVASGLATVLSMASTPVGTLALGAPIIFIAAWSGARVMPRLAPGASPVWGALACVAVPTSAVVEGGTVSLGLLTAALAPWLCVSVKSLYQGAKRPLWLVAVLCLLDPFAAPLSVALLLVARISERTEGHAGSTRRILVPTVVACCTLGVLVALSMGFAQWTERVQAPGTAPPQWVATLAAVCAAWLILGGLRRREASEVISGRTLGLLLAGSVFISGGLDGIPRFALSPHLLLVLTSLALLISVADLSQGQRDISLRYWVGASPIATVVIMAMVSPRIGTTGFVRGSAIELSAELRRKHLAWNFSVVSSMNVVPAFVDLAWVVPGLEVQAVFPAEHYFFDPKKPQQIIGTRYTYLIVDKDEPHSSRAMRVWIGDLYRVGSYPRPQRLPRLSNDSFEVYVMERDPVWEQQQIALNDLKIQANCAVSQVER